MSASGAGGSRVRRLFDRAARADSLAGVVFQGIGAVLLAGGTALSSGVLTIADVIIVPVGSLTSEVGDLIGATFGGAATIINAGALGTAVSIGPDGMFNLGPLSFALGVGSVLLAVYAISAYLSEEDTGNFFPGLPFDIPTPGFGGPEEDDQ
ncbi:hypothetical protein IL252_11190 [Halomicrobium sp. IBSBa]|uniref:Uncharacterized protein n=1 Tax=Halomicrobium mukohataei TaxID=57705 RepID=A0A847UDW4_9EURY|nr:MULTISPECIES: hypothetical protein [Halomicrobium]MBO4248378.1 hypothetical protein [Halomicrobium sp. IBSBa]NLV10676.1 hypothetical protein [Halomicrobium mukohataei]